MLIQAVLLFAILSASFEFVILMKIKPRTRLRILGSYRMIIFIHVITFIINISIHFGTVVGSMTAIVAALASFVTVPLAKFFSGTIKTINGSEDYQQGYISYRYDQIA